MKNIITSSLIITSIFCFSQKKDENIGTEVVNVIKPYTPTISDAFKIKETPALDDDETIKKETVQYHIFSFPVASTFIPAIGNAAPVDKEKPENLLKNFVSIGGGNYGTAVAELFLTDNIVDNQYIGISLQDLSSQGGIKDLDLSDKFYNTNLEVSFGNNQINKLWTIDAGYQNQVYNWYGLPTDFGIDLSTIDRENKINSIDPKHTYNIFYVTGNLRVKESIFKEMSLKFERFLDNFASAENRFYIKPTLEFELFDTKIKTNFITDYLAGNFDKNYYNSNLEDIKYGFTNLGINPNIVINKDDWTINIGANLLYFSNNIDKTSKFLVYPQVTASLKVVENYMIFYCGFEGNMIQNSYRDFTNNNPFLSPTFEVRPTEKVMDIFAGLKGKLASTISYNIRGAAVNEKYKPLFQFNDYYLYNDNLNGYAVGNSMQVIYDNVKTVSFFGELKADFSKKISGSISGNLETFVLDNEEKAWNLPNLRLNSNLDFDFSEKWYAGTNIFYVGERFDRQKDNNIVWIVAPDLNIYNKKLPSYFDVNTHIGYKYTNKFTAFLKANNLANQQYQKWLNYPVQGFQMVFGVNYKF